MGVLFALAATLSCSSGSGDSGRITENYVFSSLPIDILFVMDNSGNMQTYTADILAHAGATLSRLASKSYQFRCAVTGTDAYANTASKTEFSKKSGEAIITPQTIDYLDMFESNLNLGLYGSGTERPLESMRSALSSPFNQGYNLPGSNAFLAIIFIGNEDDQPITTPVSDYIRYLENLTGTSPARKACAAFSLSVINPETQLSGETISTRVSELCSALDGFTRDLHETDYSAVFSAFADSMASLASPIRLGSLPDTTTIQVTVNGQGVSRSETDGWEYVESANSISFRGAGIPAIGSSVKVTYMTAL